MWLFKGGMAQMVTLSDIHIWMIIDLHACCCCQKWYSCKVKRILLLPAMSMSRVTRMTCSSCKAVLFDLVWPYVFENARRIGFGDDSFTFWPNTATDEPCWVTWRTCYATNPVIVRSQFCPNGVTAAITHLSDHRFTPCMLDVVVRTDTGVSNTDDILLL